jgi:creatinine amidohydrolase
VGGRLEQLTGPAAAVALGDDATVLVPIGAIEQHGPHLPLSVDWIIADAVAQAVVDRAGEELPIWLLPTMPFSKSNEHAWSKGTIWLSQQTMMHVLDDIGRCVAESGAKRIVFLNGHGGNSTLLNVVCRELRLAYGLLTFLVHPFVPPAYSPPDPDAANSAELGMGIHGGLDETSVMLHLRPDDVDMSQAVRNVPEWMSEHDHVKFGGSVQFGWLSNDFGDDGHIGDPTGATAELGEKLFEDSVSFIIEQLRDIVGFDFRPNA